MTAPGHAYLTTREVADLLRLKERKVYDLVATGTIPHVKVTGKLLFPRDLVEAWLSRNVEMASSTEGLAERPPIVAGSHDPLLDWALRESGSGLATAFGGSIDGLRRLAQRDAMLAGAHLATDGVPLGTAFNVAHVRRQLPGQPVVVIEWARRAQGLIVARGNPLGIATVRDLRRCRVAGRQREAGSFVLLDRLLREAEMDHRELRLVAKPARTETDVAAAVAVGNADAGLGIAAVARQLDLGFVPLLVERYDLVVWRRSAFEPAVQALLTFARTPAFAEHAAALGGYDLAGHGAVHYNGP